MVLPAGGRGMAARHGRLLGNRGWRPGAVVLRSPRDVEFLYGSVADGGNTTGRFLSGARVAANGLIASYEVTFDTEFVLVED